MSQDKRVILLGCGVTSPTGVFGTVSGLSRRFGTARVIDTPIAENGITGIAIGAALAGMRPVILHQRMDFILMSMDQIVNHAAKWNYMFGSNRPIPLVIRCIVVQGWGQGPQHSQSFQSIFANIPGLKVVMPSNPYDAKGLLTASLYDGNPVIFIEHKKLYDVQAPVPEAPFTVKLGQARVVRRGRDITVIAVSQLVRETQQAALVLKRSYGIDLEIVDPRTIKPLDEQTILRSAKKTGRVLIADIGWKTCGFGAEVAALCSEQAFRELKAPITRMGFPDCPCPTARSLEKAYHIDSSRIVDACIQLMYRSQ